MKRTIGILVCVVLLSTGARAADDTIPVSPVGCHSGRLTDPRAYFFALINRDPGDSAADYVGVLAVSGLKQGPDAGVRAGSDHFGITQQIAAEGPRGVLFLPTDFPDENGYYTRQILVVNQDRWDWIERFPSRPGYAPRACGDGPPPPPPAPPDTIDDRLVAIQVQIAAVHTEVMGVRTSLEAHRAAERAFLDKVGGFFKDPKTILAILGILGGRFALP